LSEELSTSSTRLDNKTLDALKTLKTKWKLSNISEVIDKLMKDRKNFEDRIKTLEDRLQTSGQPQPAILMEAPITTKDAQKETTEKPAEAVTQVESQPCPCYSFDRHNH
jgi:hypothetical protein